MTDEWKFRTARGRGRVGGGKLRVENSLVGVARKQWVERRNRSRLLFVFSTLTTLGGLYKVVDAGRALADGSAESWHVLMLAAFGLVALVLLRRILRTRTVPLRRIRSVRRTDDDCIRVIYAESDDADDADIDDFEIETPTEADADEAVEMLQLKGVRIGDAGDADAEPKSLTFRERLAKKVE